MSDSFVSIVTSTGVACVVYLLLLVAGLLRSSLLLYDFV